LQNALQCANFHSESVSCDLYDLAHLVPVYANRRLYPCKAFPANLPYFNSPSIFGRDYGSDADPAHPTDSTRVFECPQKLNWGKLGLTCVNAKLPQLCGVPYLLMRLG
jgi:hypothetical protein